MVSNATGLWDVSDYGSTPIFASGIKGSVSVEKREHDILRRLAHEVSVLSQRDIEKQKRIRWTLHNGLKQKAPLVFCDPENGWNEIITPDVLACESILARKWEIILRKEIFWGTRMLDDKVIEPYFDIGYTSSDSGWGLDILFHGGSGGSFIWEPPVKTADDLKKLKFPEIFIDYDTTYETFSLAQKIFEGILIPRIRGVWWWSLGLTTSLAFLRGLQNIMTDMIDNPKMIHRMMRFLMNGTLDQLRFLEENKLLSFNNGAYAGSGGFGYSSELKSYPSKDEVKIKDLWGFSESQETLGISPEMFEEFVFQYQLPILALFGLNCYGCCEPLEKRWDMIKGIPNLRRVSVSSWADFGEMAGNLKDDYIYSLKVKPTDIAVRDIDEDLIKKRLRDILAVCRGCIMEIIMKDNHSIGNNPDHVITWTRIAREEAQKIT